MRNLLWAVLLLFSLSGCEADHEERKWEFVGMRAPSIEDMTRSGEDYRAYLLLECSAQLDRHYQIYTEKHPDFATYADKPSIREFWILALIQDNHRRGQGYASSCAYNVLLEDIWDFSDYDPLRYDYGRCGVRGIGMRKIEAKIITRLEVLAELAANGEYYAGIEIIGLDVYDGNFVLNPELRFYIVEVMKREAPAAMAEPETEKYFVIPDDETELSKARIAELRDAVKRRDTSVVFNEWFTCFKFML